MRIPVHRAARWWVIPAFALLIASAGNEATLAATNDLRENAVAVTASPFVHSVDTSGFNSDAFPSDPDVECGGTFDSGNPPMPTTKQTHTAWYRIAPLTNGSVVAKTLGSEVGLDTVLALWSTKPSGAPDVLLACNKDQNKVGDTGDYSEIPDINDGPGAGNLVAGTTYLIEVMSFQSSPGGLIKLTVTFDGLLAPAISTISPAGAETGSPAPLEVTVTGQGFVAGSTIGFGAANITPSTLSPTSATFSLQQAHLAADAVTSVVVKSPGGISSPPIAFVIYSRPTTEVQTMWITRGRGTPSIAISGTGFVTGLTSARIGAAARTLVVAESTAGAITLSATDDDILGTFEVQTVNVTADGPELASVAAAMLIVRSRADTTCDAAVDADDALRALQLLAGTAALPLVCDDALDPDGLGDFNLADALYIRRVVAGLIAVP